jgi:hypothetical protein
MGDVLDLTLVFLGLANLIAKVRLGSTSVRPVRAGVRDWIIVYGCASGLAALVTRGPWARLFAVAAVVVIVALLFRRVLGAPHAAGYLSLVTSTQFRIVAPMWLMHFAVTIEAGPPVKGLLAVLAMTVLVTLPIQVLDNFLYREAACW